MNNNINNALKELSERLSAMYREHDARAMQILITDLQTIPQSAHRDMMIQKARDLVYSDYNDTGDLVYSSKAGLRRDCMTGHSQNTQDRKQYWFILNNIQRGKYDTRIT